MKRKLPWDIIISKLRGDLSEENKASFDNWLMIGDNHQLFHQLEVVWINIQNKVANYEPDLEYYWKELSARIEADNSISTQSDILQKSPRLIPIKHLYRIVAAASILLVITLSGAYYLEKTNSRQYSITQSYSSLTGKSKVILPDGTEVWLHSNTTLSYNPNTKSDKREVELKGEAYFNVKHDSRRPFIVYSNGLSVKVHGTKFNVNAYSKSNNILVSLFEGSVSMKAADKDILLKPGEEGSYDKLKKSFIVSTGDVEFAKSWTNDQLRFENKNIREVCRYLSKWYSVDIKVDPSILNNQSYTFTVRDENIEEIIRIMSRINSIDYQFDSNNKLTLKAKK